MWTSSGVEHILLTKLQMIPESGLYGTGRRISQSSKGCGGMTAWSMHLMDWTVSIPPTPFDVEADKEGNYRFDWTNQKEECKWPLWQVIDGGTTGAFLMLSASMLTSSAFAAAAARNFYASCTSKISVGVNNIYIYRPWMEQVPYIPDPQVFPAPATLSLLHALLAELFN